MVDDNNQQFEDGGQEGGDEGGEGEAQDPIRNIKAEFNRKLENMDTAMKNQNQQLEQILQSIQSNRGSAPAAQETRTLKERLWDDPDSVVNEIEQRAKAAADTVVNQRVTAAQENQNAVMQVSAMYPEFGQQDSDAQKLAFDKMSKLPKSLQGTPHMVKAVMLEAAAELGLIPARSRKQSQDDGSFSVSRGNTQTTRQQRRSDPAKDIDPIQLEFAAALGVDISDPKRLEGLKKANERKDYRRYR